LLPSAFAFELPMSLHFPHFKQHDAMDCGPTCLMMIAKYYGKHYSLQTLRDRCFITREGVSMLGISDAAESIGMHSIGARVTFQQLQEEVELPCIVHWKQRHFVVVYKINKNYVYVSDPALGLIRFTKEEFLNGWISTREEGQDQGLCLILTPTPNFYEAEDEKSNKIGMAFLFKYLRPYKKFLFQLLIGMVIGSLLQLLFPFLTQSIVDIGISTQDIGFVYLILIAQLMLFVSQSAVEFIRSWILLHISTRINISIISDFLIKLMKLPLGFFDTKMIGDILQRIGDHHRIEVFLTSSSLNIIFSMINLVVFGLVLAYYNLPIFFIFILGSVLYVAWVVLFMKKRRDLDFRKFAQLADNNSNLIQLIMGIQEIKLNNCEKQKRWGWERIQANVFKINVKSLTLSQYQMSGSVFINQVKNIVISFFAAKAVIDGNMTLGMMMAVQYIIGQLNSPIDQLINFMHMTQDAKISLERLGEIHNKEEEATDIDKVKELPLDRSLHINKLFFQYEGPHSEFVLKDLNLIIPEKKVTAIVGASGSGKTTLIKLLLGFYPATRGEIKIGDVQLEAFSPRVWRQKCGVVMQDGYIFSDSIANNIGISSEIIDKQRLLYAVKMANILEFIEELPLGFNTKIGSEGHGLSQGQKQRILIARAIYKNPEFIFFDEATNALDANNELVIMENLNQFFVGRTVVVVAHRLSTVKNADQIVVLEKGAIIERGTHEELTRLKGAYYHLVKNQLELGN
jgi:ATP-binding cassette subfamily B protein